MIPFHSIALPLEKNVHEIAMNCVLLGPNDRKQWN
jgi:hypothetical protein